MSYLLKTVSRVATVRPSSLAWAMIILSKGSRWCIGRSPTLITIQIPVLVPPGKNSEGFPASPGPALSVSPKPRQNSRRSGCLDRNAENGMFLTFYDAVMNEYTVPGTLSQEFPAEPPPVYCLYWPVRMVCGRIEALGGRCKNTASRSL